MNEENKRGRGRPKGSVSITDITLGQLNEIFPSNFKIPVSALWLRMNKIDVIESKSLSVTASSEEAAPKIEFNIMNFDEDDKQVWQHQPHLV